jgi:predicted aspartyl protease
MDKMKQILTIAFLTIITNLSVGQGSFTFNQGQSKSLEYFAVIPYENVKGKIIIKAVINEKLYRFILDTGAPTTVTKDLYNDLQLKTINKLPVYDQSGRVDSMVVVSLKEISIGDVTFTDVATLVAEKTLILECFQVDGFIGSNLLRNSVVQFNDSNKTISITNNEKRLNLNPKESSDLFLDKFQSNPFFWINLENKKKVSEQLLFDSGMDDFYNLSLIHYSIFEKKNIFKILARANGSYSMGLHGASNDTISYKLQLPKMKINGTELNNVSVKTTASANSRIGSQLIEKGIVTIDYKNKKFYFSSKFGGKIDLFEKSLPVELIYRNDEIQVGIVWDDELRHKIKPGDKIIAVDDFSYEDIDVCDIIRNEPRLKDKERFTLTIKTETGVVEKVTIEDR